MKRHCGTCKFQHDESKFDPDDQNNEWPSCEFPIQLPGWAIEALQVVAKREGIYCRAWDHQDSCPVWQPDPEQI
jgi:hypothetical protein